MCLVKVLSLLSWVLSAGYPVGAKIVTNFRKNDICTKEEAERLLTFTNNSGPLFIIGTVGISLFGNTTIGLVLFITHLLASLTVGVLFRFWKFNKKSSNLNKKSSTSVSYSSTKTPPSLNNLGVILQNSIMSSISTIIMIGGFVMLFSVIISMLNNSKVFDILNIFLSPMFNALNIPTSFATGLFSGIVELTNGVSIISKIPFKAISLNIIICSFLLGFGGLSVLLQVWRYYFYF